MQREGAPCVRGAGDGRHIAPSQRLLACAVWLVAASCVAAGCAGPRSGARASSRAAYSAYIRGLMLERTARLPAALDAYELALEYDQRSPHLHARLGFTHMKLGQPEQAMKEFTQALQLDPDHLEALRWSAMLHTSQGRLDEATQLYERVLILQPDDRFVMSTLADLYVFQGQFDESIDLYRRLIAEHGSSSQLHFNLGILLGRHGRFEESLEELSRALERAPDALEIRVALGLTYELMEQPEKAAAHYEETIRRDPLNPRLHHHAARVYANSDHYADAVRHYQTILDLVPHDLEAVMGLVRVWITQKQFDRAESLLAKELAALNHPPELYVVLGVLYREAEQTQEAVRAFERAVALKADYAQAHFYLAAQLDQLGRKDEARARLRRTIELDGQHADALNYLGYLDADAGINLEEAKAFIERALLLDPANGAYMDSLGWVYYRMGRFDQAVATLERAAELLGIDPIIFDHLGDAYFAQGNHERAREQWEHALELEPDQRAIVEKLERFTSHEVTVEE